MKFKQHVNRATERRRATVLLAKSVWPRLTNVVASEKIESVRPKQTARQGQVLRFAGALNRPIVALILRDPSRPLALSALMVRASEASVSNPTSRVYPTCVL